MAKPLEYFNEYLTRHGEEYTPTVTFLIAMILDSVWIPASAGMTHRELKERIIVFKILLFQRVINFC
jgi:hypothetical protein